MAHRVTLIPGDGIGPAVIAAACRVVEAAGVDVDWDRHDVGVPTLEAGAGEALPDAVLESIRATGRCLKGPVTTRVGAGAFRSVNVDLRRRLGLFAQIRRCRSWPGSPVGVPGMDVVVIREATEDLYAGVEAASGSVTARAIIEALRLDGQQVDADAALSIKVATRAATRRAVEAAFAHAERHGRHAVVVAHKATVMRHTDGMFVEVAAEVAAAHPAVAHGELLIDNLCAALVRDAAAFDVLVMPNQYGDLVSDLAAALAGSVGLVPGVNVGDGIEVFEPAHGSAPRHAPARANPTAAILCAALLAESLGEEAAARRIERAVGEVIAEGETVTYDLKASRDDPSAVSTDAMAAAVAERLA